MADDGFTSAYTTSLDDAEIVPNGKPSNKTKAGERSKKWEPGSKGSKAAEKTSAAANPKAAEKTAPAVAKPKAAKKLTAAAPVENDAEAAAQDQGTDGTGTEKQGSRGDDDEKDEDEDDEEEEEENEALKQRLADLDRVQKQLAQNKKQLDYLRSLLGPWAELEQFERPSPPTEAERATMASSLERVQSVCECVKAQQENAELAKAHAVANTAKLPELQASLLAALATNFGALEVAPPELLADRQFILLAVAHKGFALKYAAPALQADREVVLAAVVQDGEALMFAAPALRADPRVVLAAVTQDGEALGCAAQALQADREIVLAAVTQNSQAIQYVRGGLNEDRDIQIAFHLSEVRAEYSSALRRAPPELLADRQFILAAVAVDHFGEALQYAAPWLRADREVVLAAVAREGRAIGAAASELQADWEVVLAAVAQNGFALKYAAKPLKADRKFVLEAVAMNGRALDQAAPELQADKEIVLAAVAQNGLVLRDVPLALRADRKVVLAAVTQNPEAIRYARGRLNQDRGILLAANLVGDRSPGLLPLITIIIAFVLSLSVLESLLRGVVAMKMKVLTTALFILLTICARLWGRLQRCPIVFSERCGMGQDSSVIANETLLHMRRNQAVYGGFSIYTPNEFSKGFCGRFWRPPYENHTDVSCPCRGKPAFSGQGACRAAFFVNPVTGRPLFPKGVCWRYSFRWHLLKAKRAGGAMLQIEEPVSWDAENRCWVYELGPGQLIEAEMAEALGIRVIKWRPTLDRDDRYYNGWFSWTEGALHDPDCIDFAGLDDIIRQVTRGEDLSSRPTAVTCEMPRRQRGAWVL